MFIIDFPTVLLVMKTTLKFLTFFRVFMFARKVKN